MYMYIHICVAGFSTLTCSRGSKISMGWRGRGTRHMDYQCKRATLRIWPVFTMSKHCNTLQHTTTHCSILPSTATRRSTLLPIATHCSTLPSTATHNSTLLPTITHCRNLQHSFPIRCSTRHVTTNIWIRYSPLQPMDILLPLEQVRVETPVTHICIYMYMYICVYICILQPLKQVGDDKPVRHVCIYMYICIYIYVYIATPAAGERRYTCDAYFCVYMCVYIYVFVYI